MIGRKILEKACKVKLPDNYTLGLHALDGMINRRQMIEILVELCDAVDQLEDGQSDK